MPEAVETAIQQDPPNAQPRGADGRFITTVDEETPDLDPDEQALADARAAVEAEEGGDGGDAEPPPQGDPAPAEPPDGEGQDEPPPAAAEEDPAKGSEPPPADDRPDQGKGFVPYERFEKVNDDLRSMREQMEYLRGAMDARQAQGQQPKEPEPDPRQEIQGRIAAAEQAVDQAAEQFDQGKMSMADFKRLEREQNAAIRTAQSEIDALDRPAPQKPTPQALALSDEMMLEEQVTYLRENHPYLDALTKPDAEELANIARAEARRYGKPYGSGPREDARIREHVARLSDIYGPSWFPDFKPKPRSQQPQAPSRQQQPQQPPAPSATATAREKKLDMQEQLPPDTSRMGTTGTSDQITDARILQMDEDELAALPPAVKARWLT